jgi:hypothetical protein
MVIRNAKLRMTGQPVGTWDDEVNPARVIMDVVGDCQTLLEYDALHPSVPSRKRKTILPKQATRSSKRLRTE